MFCHWTVKKIKKVLAKQIVIAKVILHLSLMKGRSFLSLSKSNAGELCQTVSFFGLPHYCFVCGETLEKAQTFETFSV